MGDELKSVDPLLDWLVLFTEFWTTETDHEAKRKFLTLIFEGVWLDERRVVAVQPKPSFLPFFENYAGGAPRSTGRKVRERRGSSPVCTPYRNPLVSRRFGKSNPDFAPHPSEASKSGGCRRGSQVRSAGTIRSH